MKLEKNCFIIELWLVFGKSLQTSTVNNVRHILCNNILLIISHLTVRMIPKIKKKKNYIIR